MSAFSRRAPSIAAWLTLLAGVMTIISAAGPIVPERFDVLSRAVPLDVHVTARVLAVQLGLVLLFLSRALRRGKRRAWYLAVAASASLVVVHLLKGLDLEEAFVHLVLLVILLAGHRAFYAKSDPTSFGQLLRFVPLYVGGVVAYGAGVVLLNRGRLNEQPTFAKVVSTVVNGLAGVEGPLTVDSGVFARAFPVSLSLLGFIGLAGAIYLLFRPILEGLVRHPDELERARTIVEEWGSDTLAYFSLRDDKNYFFSASGDAFLAYRYINGIAIVSGDPIGRAEEIASTFAAFVEEAGARGWKVAVLAGRAGHAELYESLGLRAFYLGEEAVIDLGAFSLEGRKIRKVRQSCHRLNKAGYTVELLSAADVGPELQGAMNEITHKWRGRAPERGFSMALSRSLGAADADCRVLIARDSDGHPRGFLRLVPCYGEAKGFSLDQMRREPGTPNGLTEFMVVCACEALAEQGYDHLSLNFAAFARLLNEGAELTLWEKFQRWLIKRANPYFQIESLLNFNRKFFPGWVPRYLYYEEGVHFVRVGIACLEIEAFLKLGPLRRGLLPHLDLGAR